VIFKKLRSEEIKREDIRPEMELYILKDKFYLRLVFSHANHGPGMTGPKATGLMTLLLGGSRTPFLALSPNRVSVRTRVGGGGITKCLLDDTGVMSAGTLITGGGTTNWPGVAGATMVLTGVADLTRGERPCVVGRLAAGEL